MHLLGCQKATDSRWASRFFRNIVGPDVAFVLKSLVFLVRDPNDLPIDIFIVLSKPDRWPSQTIGGIRQLEGKPRIEMGAAIGVRQLVKKAPCPQMRVGVCIPLIHNDSG